MWKYRWLYDGWSNSFANTINMKRFRPSSVLYREHTSHWRTVARLAIESCINWTERPSIGRRVSRSSAPPPLIQYYHLQDQTSGHKLPRIVAQAARGTVGVAAIARHRPSSECGGVPGEDREGVCARLRLHAHQPRHPKEERNA